MLGREKLRFRVTVFGQTEKHESLNTLTVTHPSTNDRGGVGLNRSWQRPRPVIIISFRNKVSSKLLDVRANRVEIRSAQNRKPHHDVRRRIFQLSSRNRAIGVINWTRRLEKKNFQISTGTGAAPSLVYIGCVSRRHLCGFHLPRRTARPPRVRKVTL